MLQPSTGGSALDGSTAGRWSVRLLGRFELTSGQQRHTKLATRAAMALLARLCLGAGKPHPREELAALLWPDAKDEAGRQRLRQTLSTLRQVLEAPGAPPLLQADRLYITLPAGALECDATAFEAACRRGQHERAHALYGGDFMPGFADEWIVDERLRLEGLYDRLPLPATPAVPTARAAASGPPPPETQDAPQHTVRLPSYLTTLIGADKQAADLRSLMLQHRLVTLLGPGGTGKTRLAVEAARDVHADDGNAPRFDTVAFVALAACHTAGQMLDQLLLTLQLSTSAGGALQTLVHALEGRRALLILDNFEQVVDEGAEVVSGLLLGLPSLHVVVTSRRPLALPGEQVLQAAALPLPAPGSSLADAAANPAVALFTARAQAARDDYALMPADLDAVIELVRALDGMPLAIELAAARIRSLSPAEMASTLAAARTSADADVGALDLLARPPVRGRQDTRHHSMHETIDWSWQLLTPELRALLAACTVFAGGFDAAAALAVLDTTATPRRPSAMRLALQLDELLSHSLLRVLPAAHDSASRHFGLYEPIREFAARTLSGDEAAALRRRLRLWAVAWGQAMPATPPLAALHVEMPNLLAAMSSAVSDSEPQAALDIALALRPALEFAALPGAGQQALAIAVQACPDAARRGLGVAVLALARFRSGSRNEAREMLDHALAEAPADAVETRARLFVAIVVLAFNVGVRGAELDAALQRAQAAVQVCGDPLLLARMDGVAADVVGLGQGDLARADALHHRSLSAWAALGNELAVLRSRYSLAQLAGMNERNDEALVQLVPVVEAAHRLQAWSILAPSLALRADAQSNLGQWSLAVATARDGVRMAWQALDSWNTVLPMWTLHRGQAHEGRTLQAQRLCGFLSVFWIGRFGPLMPPMVAGMTRTRRLSLVRDGRAACAQAFEHGRSLTLAQAVALALDDGPVGG